MADDTTVFKLAPVLEALSKISADVGHTRDGLDEAKAELRGIKDDVTAQKTNIEWMRTNAESAARDIDKIKGKVANLDGRMVGGIREKVIALETHLLRAPEVLEAMKDLEKSIEGVGSDIKSICERLIKIETSRAVEEKSEDKSVDTWKYVIGIVVTVILAAAPGIISLMSK